MMQNTSTGTADTRFLGSISSSSIRNLLPRSISSKRKSSSNPTFLKSNAENTPPLDPNIQIKKEDDQLLPETTKRLQSEIPTSQNEIAKSKVSIERSVPQDPPVKVVVRIRPANSHSKEGDRTIRKVSSDSLCVGARQFTFDSIFDWNSNQEDVFQTIGVPLVKNALAGYNTTLLSYGQSGSGKTYTMWGPPSAMVEEPSRISHQGIVPRIFHMLFSELQREQNMPEGKQFNYQCRCSFLEIYNEQIGDLLDPAQRNLEVKDDSKNDLYVENLTEEYVTTYEDVTQILIKGLSSRKVGATSVNSKSSRSHIIFTFIIESWCKGTSLNGFSSSKTSRISLVDLAGLDKNKVDEAGRQSLRESKNVKKSLSQLGHVVDALAKETQSGKAGDIPNGRSCLTRLLQESLGGNAMLSVICSISPHSKSNGETLRTLRFGQRIRSIRNEPVINEIKEDEVNDLSDQIRQLKEELIRAKADAHGLPGGKKGYFQGHNVRESLNQLRVSLNRSLLLPHIDNDANEEVNVGEDDIKLLRQQIDELYSSCEGTFKDLSASEDCAQFYSVDENCEEADMTSGDEIEKDEVNSEKTLKTLASTDKLACTVDTSRAIKSTFRDNISVSSCHQSPILDEPMLSESPKIKDTQRKSMAVSSSRLGSWNKVEARSSFTNEVLGQSSEQGELRRSSLRSSKVLPGPTESLAASLQRGLQIIDYHQRNLALNKSSSSFSFEHLTLTPCPESDKVDSSMQTIQEKPSDNALSLYFVHLAGEKYLIKIPSRSRLGSWNKVEARSSFTNEVLGQSSEQGELRRSSLRSSKVLPGPTESLAASLQRGLQIIDYHQRNLALNKSSSSFSFEHLTLTPCPESDKVDSSMQTIQEKPSDNAHVSLLCASCRRKISDQDSIEVQDSLKSSLDTVEEARFSDGLIGEVPKNLEIVTEKSTQREKELEDVCKEQAVTIEQLNQLVEKYRGESVSDKTCEIKEVQEELNQRDCSFDATEKEALLKEIQNLRSKLQLCSDTPVKRSTDKLRSSLISRSIQLRKSGVSSYDNGGEGLEKERERWTETESEWICLTDELRVDLESYRQRAERVQMELKLEKKCSEELDDALKRSVLGHARMVEHYADLQEKYNDLVAKHNAIMEGIAQVKKAAAKAGKKGHARFAKSLAAELSALRVERERERDFLKKENKNLKILLRDTAEAVHAAGELLVKLREAEQAATVAEDNFLKVQEENGKLRKQMEKLKRKHKMEMITMKQYLADSKLPESALKPLYREDSDVVDHNPDDDQAWRVEFGAIYQEHL
ncbi:LOW QUALITY PROTEIN: kinesin-like protein KIN-12C [Neltuma alba]|uniref:LOW QUALITY PROTEIN: kinesin-like protein KIN-12C n=1 Tax=Neltuma alba TaxID=207710 RepID=UPI0010A4A470|nr:LOW QUALITY PROTEIN: kinesin-like protein KIN-12C [Prosopis alba]